MLKSFFAALPKRLPPGDLRALEPLVSPDLKVFRDNKLAYDGRESWFSYLRSFGGTTSAQSAGISVSREKFYRSANGDIRVFEFHFPLQPPSGGPVSYHPVDPLQLVTYRFKGGQLVRVEYGPSMDDFSQLP
jgi:hypothetical protein